jgi:hypothetical protein
MMTFKITIDDTRMLDELGYINGSRKVANARRDLKAKLLEVFNTTIIESGVCDELIDAVVQKRCPRISIIKSSSKDEMIQQINTTL